MVIAYIEDLMDASARQTTGGFEVVKTLLADSGDDTLVLFDLASTVFAVGKPFLFGGTPTTLSVVDLVVVPVSGDKCRVTVIYRNDQQESQRDENGETWEWDISSEQQHVTSVKTNADVNHFPPEEDTGLGIGIDGDDVHGTDVLRPSASLRVTIDIPEGDLEFKRGVILDLASSVNASSWKGYAAGEVLFQNANIRKMKNNGGDSSIRNWRITYNFLIRKDQGEETVEVTSEFSDNYDPETGLGDVSVDSEAWDHVNITHVDKEVDGKKKTLNQSVHVYKTQPRGNFGRFNLNSYEPPQEP